MSLRNAVAAIALVLAGSAPRDHVPWGQRPAVDDLVLVVDTTGGYDDGCEQVSYIDASTGRAIARSGWWPSPGRLAATYDMSQVFSLSNDNSSFVEIVNVTNVDPVRLSTDFIHMMVDRGGPIAISPDDRVLFLALPGNVVAKYGVDSIAGSSLGPELGRFSGARASVILFSYDSRTAYVLDVHGNLHLVDVATMVRKGDPIAFHPPATSVERRFRNTFASLSPDGRYIVTNTATAKLNVIDLTERRSTLVDTPEVAKTLGVAFNYAVPERGFLAVHGYGAAAVYVFQGQAKPNPLAIQPIPAPVPEKGLHAQEQDRVGAIAWTGRGNGIIAAIGGRQEFRILDFISGPSPELDTRVDFDSCTNELTEGFGQQLDVITTNRPRAFPTATSSATVAPTATSTAPASRPTPGVTDTATLTPTSRPSNAPCPTVLPTATAVPAPAYIPLALRESPCIPGRQRIDVVLVIDASTSMQEKTASGRTKLEAATTGAGEFLDQLHLAEGDQAAVVWFNETAEIAQPLTSDRAAVVKALATIPTRQFTRLDLGVRAGRLELASPRHKSGNAPAMIVLTDGKANPVGPDAAVAEAALAKDAGVTVFTIGLGTDLDDAALASMASRPDYFYRTTNPEDLAGIYARIAVLLPCPAERWWGRR